MMKLDDNVVSLRNVNKFNLKENNEFIPSYVRFEGKDGKERIQGF